MEDEDNDEVIRSPLVALDAIEKCGYLTRLETPADAWYAIGRQPRDQDEYGERITLKTAPQHDCSRPGARGRPRPSARRSNDARRPGMCSMQLAPHGNGHAELKAPSDVEYYCRFHPNMKGAISIAP